MTWRLNDLGAGEYLLFMGDGKFVPLLARDHTEARALAGKLRDAVEPEAELHLVDIDGEVTAEL